jgi:predicted SnoaL-like aldol condensation-catalyzing enzyme
LTRTAREVVELYNLDLKVVVAGDDGEFVTIAYESPMTTNDGTETTISSIEIFRVVDARITGVWNCGYKQGMWR